MRKVLLLILPLLFVFSACHKYEDGPSFSLRTKKNRLANTWFIDVVYENGVDKTSDFRSVYTGYELILYKDNAYQLNYRYQNASDYTENGTWVFNGDKTHMIFTDTNSSTHYDWTILKLKKKELWLKRTDESTSPATEIEMHLIPLYQ